MKPFALLVLTTCLAFGQISNAGNTSNLISSTVPGYGTGAPTGSCSDDRRYTQSDATAGQNIWVCVETNWVQQGGGGGPGGNHNILSATHLDTLTGSVILGDLVVGNATPNWARFAGNITTAKQFLTQTGTGAVSAVPAWGAIALGDIPSGVELTANKNAASGYAGLTAGTKLTTVQGQEVWALADLSDVTAKTGAGTTVVLNDVPVLVGYTVAGLPAAGSAGRIAVVTDANAAGSCTTGGGSALALCRDSGAAWVALGDGGGGGGPHDILSATHSDTTAAAVTRGGIVLGVGATPKWTLHTLPTTGKYLKSDGTEWTDSTLAASGIGACGANTWVSTLNGDAAPGCTQPAFTNVSGAASLAQLPFGTANQVLGTNAAGTAQEHKTLSTGTSGTDFAIAHAANSVTFNLPTASGTNRGALSTTDWTAFNGKPALVAAGSNGIAAFNAGDDTTAARSDHTHRNFMELQWFLPGVVVSGTQTARALVPEGVTNCTITDSRISVDTTSGSSSTYNIARCTTSAGNCTATSNIYGSAVTLNASTQSVAGGAPTTATIAAGDAFKVTVTPGASLADVTVAMTYRCEVTN